MKITVLARPGSSTAILLNWLIREGYTDLDVVLEAAPRRLQQLRQRARRLGWKRALGQALFMVGAMPILRRTVAARRQALLSMHGLDEQMPTLESTLHVDTVNDPAVVERLRHDAPDLILVNGTRIIRASVLRATGAPIINTHVGITPDYRGVHGGYWALWNDEPDKFGVTLHLVDEGVDTGTILEQATTLPMPDDNIASYPLLQQIAALPKLRLVLERLKTGEPLTAVRVPSEEGTQWHHPTLLQYAFGRSRGVR